jgi:hypothetical protein
MVLGIQENVDWLQVSVDHTLVERRGWRKGWRGGGGEERSVGEEKERGV